MRSAAISAAFCAALLWVPVVQAQAPFGFLKPSAPAPPAQQPNAQPTQAQSQTPQTPQAIALPDVAAKAEDLTRLLRNLQDSMPSRQDLDDMQALLASRDQPLRERENATTALLAGAPASLELRDEENYWRDFESDAAASRKQLLAWANTNQTTIDKLNALEPQWQATLDANENAEDLGAALGLIKQSVGGIQTLKLKAQEQLRMLVNMQVHAADQDQLALDVLERLSDASLRVRSHLLQRDSLPLWHLGERRQNGENVELTHIMVNRVGSIRAFAAEKKGPLTVLFLLLVFCLFVTYRLREAVRGYHPRDETEAQAIGIVQQWVALAMLPPLLCALLLAPDAPLALIGLAILVTFYPILKLLAPLLSRRLRLLLYLLSLVYVINAAVAWVSTSAVHRREVNFCSSLLVFAVFAYLVRPGHTLGREDHDDVIYDRVILAIRFTLVFMAIALAANLFGYVKLAFFLILACTYSIFIAILVITGLKVFNLLLLTGIKTQAAQRISLVRLHGAGLVRWLPRILRFLGIFMWLLATLDLLSLRDWVTDIVDSVLNFRIAGSASNITLGAVLGFFLILLVGYAIAASLRFVLREEILSRFQLSRGLPELLASIVFYLVLLLVFFAAVNAGNVELNKFTLLTGALGVGVGFGLQNIINNFVSGLILQFERPIHIGDVLETDAGAGTVTRIGIRSSTLLTAQGAEIIIPNGNLISNRVTNWTLTEAKRRVELLVGVAYGSDIKRVMELLYQAAAQHEAVLTSPLPVPYFKEFADSSINFELQFWVMISSNWVRVKSEVALSVLKLFDDNGIEIPFPQRDLRLREADPIAAALLSGSEAMDAPGSSRPLNSTLAEDSVPAALSRTKSNGE